MRTTHWIGGKPWTGVAERTGDMYDPATGQVAGQVDFATASDVDEAVAAAREAFSRWRNASLAQRTNVMFSFRELLNARKSDLAEIITAEHGKVLSDAAGEIQRALEAVEFACGIPQLLKGGFSENASTKVDVYSIRQPLGVVGVISPFNFPAMVPLWFVPNAIACGNTVVLKPSEKDPSAANFLAELFAEAGLPDGVLNVVHGDKEAVDRILEHPDGQGRLVRRLHADRPLRLRDGQRVTASGCRRSAARRTTWSYCPTPTSTSPRTPPSRPASARPVSAAWRSPSSWRWTRSVTSWSARSASGSPALHVGDGRRPGCEMGPLVTGAHRDRVLSYLDAGRSAGAKLVVDGRGHPIDGEQAGFWLGPTLFDHVDSDMSIYTDEIFGPVLSVVRVPSYDAAVELVNANPYGNGTAIFTNDGGAARRYQNEVEVGMVGVNVPIPVPVSYYSFGGWKDSLFGDAHAYGPEGVHFFIRAKVVTSRWLDPSHGGVNLGFPQNS